MIALLALLLQAGHEFEPVQPRWKLIEDAVEYHPDTFVVVKPKEPKRTDCWREKRYSDHGQDRKLFRYDPQGRLRIEADLDEREQFTRFLRPDGTVAAFHHHRDLKLVEAWSISRDGKTLHHVQDGIGELVSEGENGAWSHTRMLPGITIEKAYRGDHLGRTSLWVGADHYAQTPEGEELSLHDSGEHWTVQGSDVDLQIAGLEIVDGKVRRRDIQRNPDVRPRPAWHSDLPRGLEQEWAIAWPKRRDAFLAQVEEALKISELDLADLNLHR